jgi:segregation and condensation protein A
MIPHSRLAITVQIEQFEGPLDLLLYLIQQHDLDISTVSLSKITDQYLSYLTRMSDLNFDIASDFLVMAATLIFWKSKALLPVEKTDEVAVGEEANIPTQEELVRRLLNRQRYLEVADRFAQLPYLGIDVFRRHNKKPPVERVWRDMNLSALTLTLQDLLTRARRRSQVLRKETVSLSSKITDFADKLTMNEITAMRSLISALPTKGEWVVTFLASLELARMKKVKVFQEGNYQDIYVQMIDKIEAYEIKLANGFDDPNVEPPVDKDLAEVQALTREGETQTQAVEPTASPETTPETESEEPYRPAPEAAL